jgi:hypothetical protein
MKIEDAFEKVDNGYTNHKIITQEESEEYQKLWVYYILYPGVESFKYV